MPDLTPIQIIIIGFPLSMGIFFFGWIISEWINPKTN